jgi:hypothetical protein
VGQDKKSREDAHAVWSKLVDAGLDVGKYTPATKPEVEAVRDAAKRASGALKTKLYEAVVEHLTNVDADAAASAIADVRDMVRPTNNLPGVTWSLFDAFLAAAVRAMAAARGDRPRLFSAETLGAALCHADSRTRYKASNSIWPFLDLLKKGDARARQVRLKLAGALDGGADEYTLPSREEVEAKRNDARAAAAANAPPPPPPPPAPRERSTRARRNPRAGWD